MGDTVDNGIWHIAHDRQVRQLTMPVDEKPLPHKTVGRVCANKNAASSSCAVFEDRSDVLGAVIVLDTYQPLAMLNIYAFS